MTMNNVPAYFKNNIKVINRVIMEKKSHKSSYIILKRPPNKRFDECAIVKINAFLSKTRSVFG